MRCKVCGAESGKYPLCRACNIKKEQGLIIKCNICNQWHYRDAACSKAPEVSNDKYLYEPQKTLISKSEQSFFNEIKNCIPKGYHVFPQINLAAFINRTDDSRYHNELFRNVDFLITDSQYSPKIVVEINDTSHLSSDRRARDEKVQNILEEAGIPILKLWTTYGVNPEYIKKKIEETLSIPMERKHIFSKQQPTQETLENELSTQTIEETISEQQNNTPQKKKGCYVATCIYGSYDCPPVWVLRRYRDYRLSCTWYGRIFIKIYYAISPWAVKLFGNLRVFRMFFKKMLDKKISHLKSNGYLDSPYRDDSSS